MKEEKAILKGIIYNIHHPEYGSATIEFPIPGDKYEHIIALLEALKIGDVLRQDCYVQSLESDYPILKRLDGTFINLDELDYLAKRLDSFDTREKVEFNAAAARLGITNVQDFINLTFCCQRATVITDFSDLEAIGKRHYITVHGGCIPAKELDEVDGRETALNLIQNYDGHVTPYGVVYDNGMKLEQFYDGRHFPAYEYSTPLIVLTIMPATANYKKSIIDYLYLPTPDIMIDRMHLRSGLEPGDIQYSIEYDTLPQAVSDVVDIDREDVQSLNNMCHAIQQLGDDQMDKLAAAVLLAKASCAYDVGEIAKNLELFDFVPGVRDAEEYGKYLIQQSGRFDYDPNLDNFYNYSQYGWERINREQGQFTELGYISYQGTMTMNELLCGDPVEWMDQQMGGM